MPLRIAIDGGGGTGKSTVAEMLAEELGIPYLNTGQLYRAVGYIVHLLHKSSQDEAVVTSIAQRLEPVIEHGQVVSSNGIAMVGELNDALISRAASDVSAHPGVRAALLAIQQDYAREHGAVMEGRDIGTVVLPDAELKVFLICSLEERVRRLEAIGNQEGAAELLARDKQDSERETAPLAKADDAFVIDTTRMSPGEVVQEIRRLLKVRAWGEQARALHEAAREAGES